MSATWTDGRSSHRRGGHFESWQVFEDRRDGLTAGCARRRAGRARPRWCRRRPRARSRGPRRAADARPSRGRPVARPSRPGSTAGESSDSTIVEGTAGGAMGAGWWATSRNTPIVIRRSNRASAGRAAARPPASSVGVHGCDASATGPERERHGGGGPEQAPGDALGGELQREAGVEVERVARARADRRPARAPSHRGSARRRGRARSAASRRGRRRTPRRCRRRTGRSRRARAGRPWSPWRRPSATMRSVSPRHSAPSALRPWTRAIRRGPSPWVCGREPHRASAASGAAERAARSRRRPRRGTRGAPR